MPAPWSLTAKMLAAGITFLVLALASTGLTLWVTWNLEGGAAAVNEAGRMRMQAYRLALTVTGQRGGGDAPALVRAFDNSLVLLEAGDPARPLFVPWSDASHARFSTVREQWRELRQQWLQVPPPAMLQAQVDAFVEEIDGFVAAIEAQMARWTEVLRMFQLAMMALAVGSGVALLYASYLLVLNPLARLQRGLAAVQQGDFTTRIAVDTRDEFGALSAGFNDMAGTLQSLYGSLEDKVREKTLRLEAERQRLGDLYEVSAFLASADTLAALAQGFARQVRRIARADASAVRWCDEGNQRYLMLADDQLPASLAQGEACLETARCLCGQSKAHAAIRVIPIRPSAAVPLDHCARAGFATVVSVPVRLHDRLLAEVDLFYREAVTPGAEDRELLDALASHLASAMESLRATALEREAAVAQERGLLAQELHDSIAQALAFMKIQVQLLRQAVERQDAPAMAAGIAELDTGVRECYADVRELLVHFRTRTSGEDIEPALRTTLQKFEHQTGLAARLEMLGHGVALAADVQVQVLHILQEALSNVRKHAEATAVVLRVSASPHWRFEVQDDGAGFDQESAAPDETHVGLRIMQERAQRIGAWVGVQSRPGHGCSVTLALPGSSTPAAATAPATTATATATAPA